MIWFSLLYDTQRHPVRAGLMPKHCHRNVLVRLDRATFEYNVHLPVIVILSSKLRLMVHLIKVALPTCQDI